MSGLQDSFKINLNQNLWDLVVALVALGAAEYFHLHILFWFALALSVIMTASIAATTLAYTVNYCNGKM